MTWTSQLISIACGVFLTGPSAVGLIWATDADGLLDTGIIPPMYPAPVVEKVRLARQGEAWDIVIIGSSHLMFIHPHDYPDLRVLNLGIPGSTPGQALGMWRLFEKSGGTTGRVVVAFDDMLLLRENNFAFVGLDEDGDFQKASLTDKINLGGLRQLLGAAFLLLRNGQGNNDYDETGGMLDPNAEQELLGTIGVTPEQDVQRKTDVFDRLPRVDSKEVAKPWSDLASLLHGKAIFIRTPISLEASTWLERPDWVNATRTIDSMIGPICDSGAAVHDLRDWPASRNVTFLDAHHLTRESSAAMFDAVLDGAWNACPRKPGI